MSYDQYTTWGIDGTRELDEDAIYREFANAGVSYCGDFSEFIDTDCGYESVNERAIRHAVEREKGRRSSEMMLFRQLAAQRDAGVSVYVNQIPVDIYIKEIDRYDSVYLIHDGDYCRGARDAAWMRGFRSPDEFTQYTERRISEGRHMLYCPFCSWECYADDPILTSIGNSIKYSLQNGRPMPRRARKKPLAAPPEKGYFVWMNTKIFAPEISNGNRIKIHFFHASDRDCTAKRGDYVKKGPFKSMEDAFSALNAGEERDGIFNFPCVRCYSEKDYEGFPKTRGYHAWLYKFFMDYAMRNPELCRRVNAEDEARNAALKSQQRAERPSAKPSEAAIQKPLEPAAPKPDPAPEFDTTKIRILSIGATVVDEPKRKNTRLAVTAGVVIPEKPPENAIFYCTADLYDPTGKNPWECAEYEGRIKFHVSDAERGIYTIGLVFDFNDEVGSGTYVPSLCIGEARPDPKCKKEPLEIKKKFRLFGR